MRGSFQRLLDSLEHSIRSRGAQILTGVGVKRIATEGGKVSAMELEDGRSFPCDQVVATVPSPLFIKMAPDSGEDYARLLRGVSYQAVICLVLKLKRPLSHIYWLNISDPDIPFVGAIEHTNYVSSENYGGHHILYLTNYLEDDDPLFNLSKDELLHQYLPGLRRLYGDFSLNPPLFRAHSILQNAGGRAVPGQHNPDLPPGQGDELQRVAGPAGQSIGPPGSIDQ